MAKKNSYPAFGSLAPRKLRLTRLIIYRVADLFRLLPHQQCDRLSQLVRQLCHLLCDTTPVPTSTTSLLPQN